MIPIELKIDEDGLFYTDNRKLIKKPFLPIDHRGINENRYDQCIFYSFDSTDEYIIKYHLNKLSRDVRDMIKEMLIILIEKQKDIPNVDFPIGYFQKRRYIAGEIIKYYKDTLSLDNICNDNDLLLLGKYYYHDENDIHNLFLLFDEYLTILYEMFENGVYYNDTNPGNIMLYNNQLKIIDFDPRRVKFDQKDKRLINILDNYTLFLKRVLNSFGLETDINDIGNNFDEEKKYVKKLEDRVRNNIR